MPFTATSDVPTDVSEYSTLELLYAADRDFTLALVLLGQGDASYSCPVPATPGGTYQKLVCNIQKDSVDAGVPGALSLPEWACADPENTSNCIAYQPDSSESIILVFNSGGFGDTTHADIMALCFDGDPACDDSTVEEGQVLKVLTDSAGDEVMAALPPDYRFYYIDENSGAEEETRITRRCWRNKNWLFVPKHRQTEVSTQQVALPNRR